MLFPDDEHLRAVQTFDLAIAQAAAASRMGELVVGDGAAQTFAHHDRAVVKKIVGGDDIQTLQPVAEPARKILREALAGDDQRHAEKVVEREINPEDHARLIDEFIDSVGDVQ